jgi:hypothetical protein
VITPLHVSPAQARRLQRNITKGERTVTPEELRVNAGWSVKPEYKEYIRQQAEANNLSASRYIENLIIEDQQFRAMLAKLPAEQRKELEGSYKDMLRKGITPDAQEEPEPKARSKKT